MRATRLAVRPRSGYGNNEDYLRILDWTGRQVRSDKRGSIPEELRPILQRLGVRGESWIDRVQDFGR